MFKSALTVFSALLLAAACAQQVAPQAHDGSVEFVLSSSTDADDGVPSQLTLTSLDRSFHTRVALAEPSVGVRVELPAGLYAVDAAASVGGQEPVIPAVSAPKLVVVSPGRLTTVNVRSVEVEPSAAVAALDAALAR